MQDFPALPTAQVQPSMLRPPASTTTRAAKTSPAKLSAATSARTTSVPPADPTATACPFCLEPLPGAADEVAMPCGHKFHLQCFKEFKALVNVTSEWKCACGQPVPAEWKADVKELQEEGTEVIAPARVARAAGEPQPEPDDPKICKSNEKALRRNAYTDGTVTNEEAAATFPSTRSPLLAVTVPVAISAGSGKLSPREVRPAASKAGLQPRQTSVSQAQGTGECLRGKGRSQIAAAAKAPAEISAQDEAGSWAASSRCQGATPEAQGVVLLEDDEDEDWSLPQQRASGNRAARVARSGAQAPGPGPAAGRGEPEESGPPAALRGSLAAAAPPVPQPEVRGRAAAKSRFGRALPRPAILDDVFAALDRDGDGFLCAAELQRFAKLSGFEGSDEAWWEEFQLLCEERGCQAEQGLSRSTFTAMLDDPSDSGCYCTDAELASIRQELSEGRLTRPRAAPGARAEGPSVARELPARQQPGQQPGQAAGRGAAGRGAAGQGAGEAAGQAPEQAPPRGPADAKQGQAGKRRSSSPASIARRQQQLRGGQRPAPDPPGKAAGKARERELPSAADATSGTTGSALRGSGGDVGRSLPSVEQADVGSVGNADWAPLSTVAPASATTPPESQMGGRRDDDSGADTAAAPAAEGSRSREAERSRPSPGPSEGFRWAEAEEEEEEELQQQQEEDHRGEREGGPGGEEATVPEEAEDSSQELYLNTCALCGETWLLPMDLGEDFLCHEMGAPCGAEAAKAAISTFLMVPEAQGAAAAAAPGSEEAAGGPSPRWQLLCRILAEGLATLEASELLTRQGLEPLREGELAALRAELRRRGAEKAAARAQAARGGSGKRAVRYLQGVQVEVEKGSKYLAVQKETREDKQKTSVSLLIIGSRTKPMTDARDKKKGPRS